jgi:hypothetical protein
MWFTIRMISFCNLTTNWQPRKMMCYGKIVIDGEISVSGLGSRGIWLWRCERGLLRCATNCGLYWCNLMFTLVSLDSRLASLTMSSNSNMNEDQSQSGVEEARLMFLSLTQEHKWSEKIHISIYKVNHGWMELSNHIAGESFVWNIKVWLKSSKVTNDLARFQEESTLFAARFSVL